MCLKLISPSLAGIIHSSTKLVWKLSMTLRVNTMSDWHKFQASYSQKLLDRLNCDIVGMFI